MSKKEPSAALRAIGKRIRKIRDEHGWSQALLAEKADLTPEAISNFERAYYAPSIDRLDRIAKALGVTLRDLMPEADDIDPTNDEKLIIEMTAAARQLDPAALKVAVDQVQGLVQIGAKKKADG